MSPLAELPTILSRLFTADEWRTWLTAEFGKQVAGLLPGRIADSEHVFASSLEVLQRLGHLRPELAVRIAQQRGDAFTALDELEVALFAVEEGVQHGRGLELPAPPSYHGACVGREAMLAQLELWAQVGGLVVVTGYPAAGKRAPFSPAICVTNPQYSSSPSLASRF